MALKESVAFQRVQPLCVNLSRQSFLPRDVFDSNSVVLLESLKSLEEELKRLENEGVNLSPKFADYVFVPIASLLRQDSLGPSQTEALLQVIGHLVSLCWSSAGSFHETLAQQLFALVTFLISNDKDNSDLLIKTPSFQLAGCVVLRKLFKAFAAQKAGGVFDHFKDPKNLPSLGHSVAILLDILGGNDNEVDLQLAAIAALEVLYQETLNDGEIISFIVPGNVSAFSKLLVKPGLIVNPRVVCSTLRLFAAILRMVYSDSDLHIVEHSPNDLNELLEEAEKPFKTSIVINEVDFENRKLHRDTKWLRATSAQIYRALQVILPKLAKRDNDNINSAICEFISIVMKHCRSSLKNCQKLFFSVALELHSVPAELVQTLEGTSALKLIVDNKVTRISNAIQFEDTKALQTIEYGVQTLNTYQCLDFEMVDGLVFSLKSCISDFLEQKNLRFTEGKLKEQGGMVIVGQDFLALTESSQPLLPKISTSLEEVLSKLLHTLGTCYSSAHIQETVGELLSFDGSESGFGKAVSLWMSAVLVEAASEVLPDAQDITNEFMTFESDEQNVADVASEPIEACYDILESSVALIDEAGQNIITLNQASEFQIAVGLKSIQIMSETLGEEFRTELIDVLFPVVDCLASPSPNIRHFAQTTTLSIANSFYDGSIHGLLLDNIDYLVDAVSVRLNNCMTQRVPTLLMVLCRIGGYDLIKSFKDVLEIIFRLLDFYHGYEDLCCEFFQLFGVIVTEMRKTYFDSTDALPRVQNEHSVSSSFKPWGMQNILQVLDIVRTREKDVHEEHFNDFDSSPDDPSTFQEFFDRRVHEVDSDDEEDDFLSAGHSEGEGLPETTEEGQPLLPGNANDKWVSPIPRDSYRLLLQIIGYGDRLLTHPSRQLKVQILQLMSKVFPMLATQHDMLLPQVSKSWDVVVQLSLNPDFAISKVACECLREIIHCSGDFVTKRFVDLWGAHKAHSPLLGIVAPKGVAPTLSSKKWLVSPKQFPPITKEALISLSEMLLEGIVQTELFTSEVQLQEMVYCCLLVLPKEHVQSRSLLLGDIVSFLSL
ncbi:LAQU0S01e09648g1_1 [Lachancea quebecensis]|uniref:LAQU0S01e09648g1_1 n=1 Tax=Lachancea quebecensis TaxID=1654605 RepID=A0A0P1KLR8_9SACH|nr:LAQU0S01e09648g1_1 [Lachancea quebecensis]